MDLWQSTRLIDDPDLKITGIIQNEKKEEIKKKIENEKKLQEAIKKAKEKGIQTAQITNTIPLIEQLNYKNMNLLYNERMASLLGENDNIYKVKKNPAVRSEFKELKDKIRQEAEQMVRTSEDIVEWQKEGQSLQLLANYKPFTKNLPNNLENNFQLSSSKRIANPTAFDRSPKKSIQELAKKSKLPRDIEKIALIEENPESYSIQGKKKSKLLSFLPYKETLYDKVLHIFEDDYIEPCSITWDMEFINNPNQDIPYYRELAPYARDIINMKENHKKTKQYDKISIDLLNEGEFLLDEEQLNFEDLMNIISGRISSRILHKILNRNDIHSLIDENEEIDEDFEDVQITTEEKFSSQETSNKPGNMKRIVSSNFPRSPKDKVAISLKKSKEDSLLSPPAKSEKDFVEYTNDPRNFKTLLSKRTKKEDQVEFGIQANEYDIYEELKPQMNKTDSILREITDIKEAKENTKQLPKADTVNKLQKRLNLRLEENLIKLLLIILDKSEKEILEIKDKPEVVKEQIRFLLKNIDKLKGAVIDGHPKPKLLFKFLKEYRKLIEEAETNSKLSNQLNFASFDNDLANAPIGRAKTKTLEGSPNSSVLPVQNLSPFQGRNMGSVNRSVKRKATPGWGQEQAARRPTSLNISGFSAVSNALRRSNKKAPKENSTTEQLSQENWKLEKCDFKVGSDKNI